MRTRIRRLGALAVTAALSAGCTVPFQIGREAKDPVPVVSDDGLQRVKADRIGIAYLRSDTDFAAYTAVMLDPCTLAYASPPVEPTVLRRRIGNYRLDPERSERMTRGLREAFAREFERSGSYRVVAEPGPGVLRVACHIADLVWEVPRNLVGETYWVKRTGLMTLLLSVRDSESGRVLARIGDRRAIRPLGESLSGSYENLPVNNWAGVRDVSRLWARVLREGLDSLRDNPPLTASSSP